MSWTPDIKNVYQPLPKGGILKTAAKKLVKTGKIDMPKAVLRDSHGTYGYRYNHFLLLAKDEPYGFVVSVHKTAIGEAIKYKIPIWLYLNANDTFYIINPEEILLNKIEENSKGEALMVNFSIKIAKRVEL